MKKKVLVVLNYYPHYREGLIGELLDNGDNEYSVVAGNTCISPALKLVDPESLRSGIKKTQLSFVNNRWLGRRFLWQEQVWRPSFIKEFDVVIHTGSVYQLSSWFSVLTCKIMGKKMLFWTHGLRKEEYGLKRMIRLFFYKLSDGLLLYGYNARDILISYGLSSDRLYVVYNSLDYNKQALIRENIADNALLKVRKELFVDFSLPIIIYVGRLVKEKNPGFLIDLMEFLIKRGEKWNILVVGDGPEFKVLKERIKCSGFEGMISLYGATHDEEELAKLLMASDVSLMPNALGLSAMHCLAYGLPVLTSDDKDKHGPEFEAIVPGVTGDFYKNGDLNSLAIMSEKWKVKKAMNYRNMIFIIEKYYNPGVQRIIFDYAVSGGGAENQPFKRSDKLKTMFDANET